MCKRLKSMWTGPEVLGHHLLVYIHGFLKKHFFRADFASVYPRVNLTSQPACLRDIHQLTPNMSCWFSLWDLYSQFPKLSFLPSFPISGNGTCQMCIWEPRSHSWLFLYLKPTSNPKQTLLILSPKHISSSSMCLCLACHHLDPGHPYCFPGQLVQRAHGLPAPSRLCCHQEESSQM